MVTTSASSSDAEMRMGSNPIAPKHVLIHDVKLNHRGLAEWTMAFCSRQNVEIRMGSNPIAPNFLTNDRIGIQFYRPHCTVVSALVFGMLACENQRAQVRSLLWTFYFFIKHVEHL